MATPNPRVLHCISHLALGGAERVAMHIIQLLDTQIDFSVFAVRGLNDGATGAQLAADLQSRKIPLQCGARIPMRFGGMISGAIGMARAIRRFKPEVIHLHSEIPEASYAVMVTLFPSLRRLPVIRTIHNSVIWSFSPKLGYWCDRRLAHAYCIPVSQGAALAINRLRRESGGSPLPEPARVIYNAVPGAPALIARPARNSTVIKLLFGARFEDEKGADLLPAIVSAVQLAAGQEIELTIFGRGQHHAELAQLAKTPPPGWRVGLRPPIPNFREELYHHDLFLMPSRFEGLPLVALEAALANLPIVATNAPGLTEALPENHPWLAELDDAQSFAQTLTEAVSSRAVWATVAQNTRNFVAEKFTPAAMARDHLQLYTQVTKRS